MFHEIALALGRGEAVALVTVIRTSGAAPCAAGSRLLIYPDGATTGTLGSAATDARAREEALRALADGVAHMSTYHLDPAAGESVGSCGATLEVFVEPLRPEPRLLVAGSGYVAQALARLVAPLGWRVSLLDDRSEFVAEYARSGAAMERITTAVGELPALLRAGQPDPATAIVVVTRGHRSDKDALRAALDSTAGYVGMIGSPGKVRVIYRALLAEGYTWEALARTHAPIGLDLGAQTPDEIALSIAAELLMWRRGASGLPLRERHGVLATLDGAAEQEQQEGSAAVEAGG